jgi:hypothetical protein
VLSVASAPHALPGDLACCMDSQSAGFSIFAFNDSWEHLTIFLIPVRQWSDGTADR